MSLASAGGNGMAWLGTTLEGRIVIFPGGVFSVYGENPSPAIVIGAVVSFAVRCAAGCNLLIPRNNLGVTRHPGLVLVAWSLLALTCCDILQRVYEEVYVLSNPIFLPHPNLILSSITTLLSSIQTYIHLFTMRYSIISAIAIGSSLISAAPAPPPRSTLNFGPPPGGDVDILNYALTLEFLERKFYQEGLANFTQADFVAAGFPDPFYANLKEIAYDEQVSTYHFQIPPTNIY